ncbi:hypothetical protein SSP531S_36680 [Streptomyces spongiicola]|uniref:Uncharacterized protein n=1 Tax=Streptomyces spongiicola TaxID=1690221 RepID=A0A388T250_9ACTN|nr:hypothetical protein SSP531S_36680 [Streptomyces spongiicola]
MSLTSAVRAVAAGAAASVHALSRILHRHGDAPFPGRRLRQPPCNSKELCRTGGAAHAPVTRWEGDLRTIELTYDDMGQERLRRSRHTGAGPNNTSGCADRPPAAHTRHIAGENAPITW